MNNTEQLKLQVSTLPRRTSTDWDNYLVEKMVELRQLVDKHNNQLDGQFVK